MLTFQLLIHVLTQSTINLIRKVTIDNEFDISLRNQEKCHSCGGFLSYFPIFLTKDAEHICGRCPVPENSIRNKIFESSVSSISFPCLFQNTGCPAKLLPKDVPKHEENCSFRVSNCLFSNCSWRGASSALFKHCDINHQEFMLEEDKAFGLYLSKDLKNTKSFILHNEELLTIAWSLDVLKMKFGLLIKPHYHNEKKLVCRLTAQINEDFYSLDFATGEYAHILCSDLDINLQDVSKSTRPIGIVLSFADAPQKLTQISWQQHTNQLFSSLKCSRCSSFLFSPIFTSVDGAVFCHDCGNVNNSVVNTALVNIAKFIQYPCKNNEFGCMVAATPGLMKVHQEVCKI